LDLMILSPPVCYTLKLLLLLSLLSLLFCVLLFCLSGDIDSSIGTVAEQRAILTLSDILRITLHHRRLGFCRLRHRNVYQVLHELFHTQPATFYSQKKLAL
jgi:hypothetical protein